MILSTSSRRSSATSRSNTMLIGLRSARTEQEKKKKSQRAGRKDMTLKRNSRSITKKKSRKAVDGSGS